MRPVTIHMSSARYANRSDGLLRYKVTVSLWSSQIASMRAYYRQQRKHFAYPEARMITAAQFAVAWQERAA